MQEKVIKNASIWGAPGCAIGAWVMMQAFPKAPDWLVILAAFISAFMIAISVYYWIKALTWPKPKKEVTDKLYDMAVEADKLIKERIEDITDLVLYQESVKAWVDNVEQLLMKETNDEEVHMFKTMPPMINGNESVDICRAAIVNRIGKLRLITGRYFRGENVKK